jgi:hypothetical protein
MIPDMDDVVFERRFLERLTSQVRLELAKEQLERLGATGLEVAVEDVGRTLAIRLCKHVLADRLASKVEDVEAWVDVPWSCEVLVEPEPRWWHRWAPRALRPKDRWITVSGSTQVRGTVKVKVEHLVAFPESTISYPSALGTEVAVTRITPQADPRWTEQDVRVRDYPSAAESTST